METIKTTNNNNKNNKIRRRIRPRRLVRKKTQYIEPNRINDFRNKTGDTLLRELKIYHRYVKNRYLLGLVHPDLAVKEQIPVKLYSDVPIPTASIGFHQQTQFTTSSNGTFLLSWRPNFIMTAADLSALSANDYSQITYNNSAALTGNTSVAGNAFVPGSVAPAILIQRYRLVSAIIKISYNGSVLNQSGTMISSCTFEPFSVAVGSTTGPVATNSDALVDRYGNFSLISNGLWNTSVDITNNSQGLEMLYVPTDPDDYVFSRQGRYFDQLVAVGLNAGPAEGAHIQYVVAGRNLPASSPCVMMNVYYNYEVIADPTAASYLRSSPDSVYSAKDKTTIQDTITGVVKQGSLIKPIQNANYKDVLMDIAKTGISYIPKLLGSLLF